LVERGFFDKKIDYLNIHVVIPTMVWSKFMMRARERNKWKRIVHLPK
jgi:site-specific recombinase